MSSYSNSSLNCFTSCMKKYQLRYIDGMVPEVLSPHLVFGDMGHKVLYDAGCIRDEKADYTNEDILSCIPGPFDYPELQQEFKIYNWTDYFQYVLKDCWTYEDSCINMLMSDYPNSEIQIHRELKLNCEKYLTKDDILVGVIDLLLIIPDTAAVILDYKFSTSRKTQADFDENSQLVLYAYLVHENYNIPISNIRVGYIDIPKTAFDKPMILKNGTLSRSKSQNVSQDIYKDWVTKVHNNDRYYNCNPGGYYYDIYCELANKKAAYLNVQYIDASVYDHVFFDVLGTIRLINGIKDNDLPFVRKYDSYSCKNCEYKDECKKWLSRIDEEL